MPITIYLLWDMNSDGYDDIAIAELAPNPSKVRVYSGSTAHCSSSFQVPRPLRVDGGARDFSGDGLPDLIIGTPDYSGVAGAHCGKPKCTASASDDSDPPAQPGHQSRAEDQGHYVRLLPVSHTTARFDSTCGRNDGVLLEVSRLA